MMDENEVVMVVKLALDKQGWTTTYALTDMRGYDVYGERNDERIFVEAKGVTTSKSTSRIGKVFNGGQLRTIQEQALYRTTVIRCSHPEALVAMAFPGHPTLKTSLERIKPALEIIRVGLIWAEYDGTLSSWNCPTLF